MENTKLTLCRPVIVLGTHRSGTSVVSDLVHRWGAYTGDLSHHRQEDHHNPGGFFEYQPMVALLGELASRTAAWNWSREFQEAMHDLAFDPELREKAQRMIAEMEAPGTAWLWKDPNLPPFLRFWERFWKDPVYVVTVRNPYESSRSFEKMFLPPELLGRIHLTVYFFLLWQCAFRAVLEHLETKPVSIFISYEELLRSPEEQCVRLCDFLDDSFGLGEGRDARLEQVLKVVDPKLWRNRTPVSFLENADASEAQKELYRYLLGRVGGSREPFDAGRYPLPTWAQEYLDNASDFLLDIGIQSKRAVAERARK
jgi:hypothetical protein